MGRPGKCPLESDCKVQADKENVPADGEEPANLSVKSIRCQYTDEQKKHVVLYARHHGVHPTEGKFDRMAIAYLS